MCFSSREITTCSAAASQMKYSEKRGATQRKQLHKTTFVRNTHNKKSKWFRSFIVIKTSVNQNTGALECSFKTKSFKFLHRSTNILICTYIPTEFNNCMYISILWWSLIPSWNNQFSLVHLNPLKPQKNGYPTRLKSLLV